MTHYLQQGTYFEGQYKNILSEILRNGRVRKVRGFDTLELSPFVFTTDNPLNNVIENPIRKINKSFMIAEWLWMMSGRKDVDMVAFYNSNIAKFSDNGTSFNGAYGPRISDQLDYILECFKNDINTRQAIIQIWRESPKKSKDIPCTLCFQFLHNNGKLDMIATMRSNDAWLGLPYDFFNFTMIQNYISFLLNLKVGRYTHQAGSEHIYSEHFDKVNLLISEPAFIGERNLTPQINNDELPLLLSIEESLRRGQDCSMLIEILHEPWKSMAITLETFCKNKHNKSVQST